MKELGLGYIKHSSEIFKMISYGGNTLTVRAHNYNSFKVLLDHYNKVFNVKRGETMYKKDSVKNISYTLNGELAVLYSSQTTRVDEETLEADIVFDYYRFIDNDDIINHFTKEDVVYMKSLNSVNKFNI